MPLLAAEQGTVRDDQKVKDVLSELTLAYQNKDIRSFMQNVSPAFSLGKSRLEQAVQRDFAALGNVAIRYTVNRIAYADGGRISVDIFFQRTISSRKTGQTLNDSGETQFVFEPASRGPQLYALKSPVIFGISFRENLAVGAVIAQGKNDPAARTYINPVTGDIGRGAAATAPAAPAQDKTASLSFNNIGGFWCESFVFATGSKLTDTVDPRSSFISGSFTIFDDSHVIITGPGIGVQRLGFQSLSSVISVPTSGYAASSWPSALRAVEGDCYAFQLSGGAYGIIEITRVGNPTQFRYKYSATGPGF